MKMSVVIVKKKSANIVYPEKKSAKLFKISSWLTHERKVPHPKFSQKRTMI